MEGAPLKRGAATIAMLGKAPILPAAYVGPKNSWLNYRTSDDKIGEPIDTTDIPKDLKRNEKVEYLTKEIENAQINYKKNSMRLLNV